MLKRRVAYSCFFACLFALLLLKFHIKIMNKLSVCMYWRPIAGIYSHVSQEFQRVVALAPFDHKQNSPACTMDY